jgi:EAL domain-containing protein (putative c-di-GMP-specific phosphodiesterase class I)
MGQALHRPKGAGPVATTAGLLMSASWLGAAGVVLAALTACTALSLAAGEATLTPKYWFFFPIMLAAARFRWRGALVTSLAATVLAGPVLPSTVPVSNAQELASWLTRGLFFVVMGQVLAALFAVALAETVRQRNALKAAKALSLALLRDEFVVWYQPVVDLHSGTTVGAEALVRWNHPTAGLITPGDFIESAEDSGIIIPLGAHVLETACRQLALWRESSLRHAATFKLAVNISAVQLSTPDLVGQLEQLLHETGIPAGWLCLEITETAAIADLEHIARKVEQIRALGVQIAIDDFGIGHNSLQHLSRLPVDVVKIDQSFVAALDWQPGWRGMAAAVIALARTLGMRTVAEGVETAEQAARLRELGADLAQGYWYGKAQPASAFTPLLERQRDLLPRVRMLRVVNSDAPIRS